MRLSTAQHRTAHVKLLAHAMMTALHWSLVLQRSVAACKSYLPQVVPCDVGRSISRAVGEQLLKAAAAAAAEQQQSSSRSEQVSTAPAEKRRAACVPASSRPRGSQATALSMYAGVT
jgi:hypothetical protein